MKVQWVTFRLAECAVAYNMPIQLLHWTPVIFSLHTVKNDTHTLFLIENTCMWLVQGIHTSSKMTSVKTFRGLSRVDSFWQNNGYHSESFDGSESGMKESGFLFSFFKQSVLVGMKKDFGTFRMNTSECVCVAVVVFFPMDNATCPLHWCIGWVRHLWPSGDWEPVFACR